MSKNDPINADVRSIREQIRQAVDPTGEQFELIEAVEATPVLPESFTALKDGLAEQWAQLGGKTAEYRHLLVSMEDSLHLLVPRGWAPFRMDSSIVAEAIRLIEAGQGTTADELLASQWDGEGSWRTKQVSSRVSVLGAGQGQPEYHALFQARSRLIRKAKEHHEAGNYEASIPLMQNQMEGLVMDVAGGRKFFSKDHRYKADLLDPLQLVSIEACLVTLQKILGEGVNQTQSAGSLSRHGIAHGRELAYDTRVNSAKYWSVLDALVEWVRPMAQQEAQRLRREREAASAGSQSLDDHGRRVDNREFRETKDFLRKLLTSAMGWLASTGKLRRDLVGNVYTTKDFTKAGLPADPGIHTGLSSDGTTIWFWRTTISGWNLGAGVGIHGDGFDEWLYSGPTPALLGPHEDSALWGKPFDTPPDWTSG